MIESGVVYDVVLMTLGSMLARDHTAGETVVSVSDAGDFDTGGGEVAITSYPGGSVSVNLYDYTTADIDTNTVTLTTGLVDAGTEGDAITVSPLQSGKVAKVRLASDDAITARVPHQLESLLRDGTREDVEAEAVIVQMVEGNTDTLGTHENEWVVVDVLGSAPGLTSVDYTEGASGWGLGQSAQFEDVNVLGEVGSDVGTFNSLTLGTQDLETEVLGAMPLGQIALGKPTISQNTANVSSTNGTELLAFQFNAGQLYAGRQYRITYQGSWNGTNLVVGDIYETRLRYTTDGSTPTTSSTIMDGSLTRTGVDNAGVGMTYSAVVWFSPGTDCVLKMCMTGNRQSGSGSAAAIKVDSTNFGPFFSVEDMGLQTNVGGQVSQMSKAGGGSDPLPGATFTRRWLATDHVAYDWDDHQRAGGQDLSIYQGWKQNGHGLTKTLVFFDDADIRSVLTGATIVKVTLTFRVKGATSSSGVDANIYKHSQTSVPFLYSMPTSGSLLYTRYDSKPGSTYTVTLPNSFGTEMQSGASRGVTFGAPDNAEHWYGYFYGSGQYSGWSNYLGPILEITYSK